VTAGAEVAASELEELALDKLTRVLGASAGPRVFLEAMRELGLTRLETADQLHALAAIITRRGGFEGAVGGLLAVAAVMRGATGRS
jgi:hypothetical protein